MTSGGATLEHVRVLVVGASAGIGRAVAQDALRRGASVVFAARRAEALEGAIAEVDVPAAGRGIPVAVDVRSLDDCARLAAIVATELGGLDVLVYATAVSPLRRLVDSDATTWAQVLEANLVGAHAVVRALLPSLTDAAIVGVLSSDSVGAPRPGLVPYASSKAALEELIRGLRVEHPRVRWTCITVGPTVPTEFGIHFDPELAGELFVEWARLGMSHASMMQTTDVAEMIVGTVQLLRAFPGIGCEHLVLRPASGIVETSYDMQAQFDAMRADA